MKKFLLLSALALALLGGSFTSAWYLSDQGHLPTVDEATEATAAAIDDGLDYVRDLFFEAPKPEGSEDVESTDVELDATD